MNVGEQKEPRLSKFKELLALIEEHKRKKSIHLRKGGGLKSDGWGI